MKGMVASTRLQSNGDIYSLGKRYFKERRFNEWRYIESSCVSSDSNYAIQVQYVDNQFIKLANDDLVLDVAFWDMKEGTGVNFVGGVDFKKTKVPGGGRDWKLNDDGTISAKHHPHLVLGF